MHDVAALEREDIAMFINAACACSGQSEFYGADRDQRVSLAFLHDYVFGNYRTLYALCLVAGINHFNQALIVERLLTAGAPFNPTARALENRLLALALARLPPQRVYRLFGRLRRARVNNRRTRATIDAWLAQRDRVFDAVKYRGLFRSTARHAHLGLHDEVRAFLFEGPQARKRWEQPLFDAFRRARYEQAAIFELPFTVAEGFAAVHGIPRKRFLERIQPRMTEREKQRTLQQVEGEGVKSAADLERLPLTAGCSLVLSLPYAERTERWATALRDRARREARGLTVPAKVRGVFDNSYSSRGGAQKRNRPLAVALGVCLMLEQADCDFRAWWTAPVTDPLLNRPHGQTDLVTGLLSALEDAPDLLVVVSDGFENDPPGAAGEVIRLFRTHVDPHGKTRIVHLNPVFDATAYMPRTLGNTVPTVGIRDAEELDIKLRFARFTLGSSPLSEIEAWLRDRLEAL